MERSLHFYVDGLGFAIAQRCVDGGETIQRFLRAGLIDRMVITRVPVLIGDGIPLFGTLPRDVALRHVASRHFPSGLVQSEYEVAHTVPQGAALRRELGDRRALPALRTLNVQEDCDHTRLVCQREVRKAIAKLNGEMTPRHTWRLVVDRLRRWAGR